MVCQVCDDPFNVTPPPAGTKVVLCPKCIELGKSIFAGTIMQNYQVSYLRGYRVGLAAVDSYKAMIEALDALEAKPFVSITLPINE